VVLLPYLIRTLFGIMHPLQSHAVR
jgi:hypothetical protein